MANLFSLCNQIEQFLQDNDQPTIDRLIRWLEVRLKWKEEKTSGHDPSSSQGKSLINTSQIFLCPCGHRYSLRFSMADLLASTDESISADSTRSTTTEEKALSPIVSACKRVKTTIAENHSSKLLICTHCQIRLHTRETFLQHYSMHQQGYSFCKRCFQFYLIANGQNQMHDCERGKSVSTNNETVRQTKCDELHSLEQLIPPDTLEQPESNAIGKLVCERRTRDFLVVLSEHANEHDAVSAARLTRFGLPILTDSIVEMTLPDGKRQFRCPLCLNSYVNRSGLNRHYITHSSQDLWKVGQCYGVVRRAPCTHPIPFRMSILW